MNASYAVSVWTIFRAGFWFAAGCGLFQIIVLAIVYALD
jgi:hypothetical protein